MLYETLMSPTAQLHWAVFRDRCMLMIVPIPDSNMYISALHGPARSSRHVPSRAEQGRASTNFRRPGRAWA